MGTNQLSFTDLLRATLSNRKADGSWITLLPLRRWFFVDNLLNKEKMVQEGGTDHAWMIAYKEGASTVWAKPGAVRNPSIGEYLVEAKLAMVNNYYQVAYHEHEMRVNRNAGPKFMAQQIVRLIDMRRSQEKLGHLKNLEEKFVEPPVTTGENLTPHGLPYHIVPITSAQKAAGTGGGAFQGRAMTGGNIWSNIDLTTLKADGVTLKYDRLFNYNAARDGATSAITITSENKIRLSDMFRRCSFEAPDSMADLKTPSFDRFRLIADEYVIKQLGVAGQSQNDNLGSDLLQYMGVRIKSADTGTLVNGLPVRWCETLDTYSAYRGYHPMYALNLDELEVVYDPQNFMRKRPPASDEVHTPDQIVEYFDSTMTIRVRNRQQAGGLIAWVA